jgi:tol-pal system protein YbgF
MTVGVALSVTPIFNYALAQQGNSATQLMLQVQTMREEVGELRDLIERQQFQLGRLQRQVDAQAKQLELIKSAGSAAPLNGMPTDGDFSNYNNLPSDAGSQTEPQPSYKEPQPISREPQSNNNQLQIQQRGDSSATTHANQDSGTAVNAGQQTASAVNQNDYNRNAYNSSAASPSSEQGAATQQQNGSGVSLGSAYPPVIDRSFSTSTPDVPVTGAGTQQPSSPTQQAGSGQVPVGSQAGGVLGSATLEGFAAAQGAANTTSQNQQPVFRPATNSGAIVSVPIQAGSIPSSAATVVGQVGQARESIDAGQIPSQAAPEPTGQRSVSNQSALSQPVPNKPEAPAVVSEEDFYAQGFELLKQSKYEEAASIFEQQLKTHPQGDLADDAHYWIAEAMHVSRKLDVAKVHLKAIISDYPQSRRVPDAMLKTAYIEQSQGNEIEARILFQEIVNMHPQSDAAIAAKNQLAAAN